VFVSLHLFPNPQMNEMIENIFADHQLVLSSFVVDELKEVVIRKFPSKIKVVECLWQNKHGQRGGRINKGNLIFSLN